MNFCFFSDSILLAFHCNVTALNGVTVAVVFHNSTVPLLSLVQVCGGKKCRLYMASS